MAPSGQESGCSGKVKLGRCLQFLTRQYNVTISFKFLAHAGEACPPIASGGLAFCA